MIIGLNEKLAWFKNVKYIERYIKCIDQKYNNVNMEIRQSFWICVALQRGKPIPTFKYKNTLNSDICIGTGDTRCWLLVSH